MNPLERLWEKVSVRNSYFVPCTSLIRCFQCRRNSLNKKYGTVSGKKNVGKKPHRLLLLLLLCETTFYRFGRIAWKLLKLF
jgi:hypothetical protein